MKDSDKLDLDADAATMPDPKKGNGVAVGTGLLFILASFLIYLPVLNRFFVSDDFKVLFRVCVEKTIFIKRFFRPLSDISIYLNFRLDGLNPVVFNSFNILVHGINSYLVYLFCLCTGNRLTKKKRTGFALISGALFLCYPFHNEAVVWILGRGASMACLFSLLSVICYYKLEKGKTASVCLFYFISLSAFESTFFFPVVFIFLLIYEREKRFTLVRWAGVLSATACLHLILRYLVAGSLLGSYGADFFHSGAKVYFLNMAKLAGRLILPPSGNALGMTAVSIGLLLMISFFGFRHRKKLLLSDSGRLIVCCAGMLLVSCIIPVITGVSTQTSESDRMMYFPSVFLCMIAGGVITFFIEKPLVRSLVLVIVFTYNIFFLEKNNQHWRKASAVTFSILEKINIHKRAGLQGTLYFLNIPNEINGAYVFRLGFGDALKMYGFDSSHCIAVNYLPRQDLEKMKEKTRIQEMDSLIVLPPDIFLKKDSSGCREIFDHGELKFTMVPGDQLYFWNIDRLDAIQACPERSPG